MNDDDSPYSSLWIHIEDLRRHGLRALAIIMMGVILSFICYQPLINFLTAPLNSMQSEQIKGGVHTHRLEPIQVVNPSADLSFIFNLPKDGINLSSGDDIEKIGERTYRIPPKGELLFFKPISNNPLVLLGPLEGILTALKVSFWVGVVGTSPLWLLALLQFIVPALHPGEKILVYPFLAISFVFVLCGISFAFFVTVPIANQYLVSFNQTVGTNLWSLERYLDYTLFLLLANGFAFELGALGFFAVHLGLISAEGLMAKRRLAIVGAFILGALLTPPDVLTQLMLAIPLILLYEGLILFAKCRKTSLGLGSFRDQHRN